jgi:peroxiredoxin
LAALGGFFRKTYGILVGNPASLEKFLDKVVRVYDKSNMVVYDSVTRKMRIVLG